jgi:hypothetical protein
MNGTKRISGVFDNGKGYELYVKKDCKFSPVTNTCCGNCTEKDDDCTLKQIQSKETINKIFNELDYYEIFDDEDDVKNILADLEIFEGNSI